MSLRSYPLINDTNSVLGGGGSNHGRSSPCLSRVCVCVCRRMRTKRGWLITRPHHVRQQRGQACVCVDILLLAIIRR